MSNVNNVNEDVLVLQQNQLNNQNNVVANEQQEGQNENNIQNEEPQDNANVEQQDNQDGINAQQQNNNLQQVSFNVLNNLVRQYFTDNCIDGERRKKYKERTAAIMYVLSLVAGGTFCGLCYYSAIKEKQKIDALINIVDGAGFSSNNIFNKELIKWLKTVGYKYFIGVLSPAITTASSVLQHNNYFKSLNHQKKTKFVLKEIGKFILSPQNVLGKYSGNLIYDVFITRPQKKQIIQEIKSIIENNDINNINIDKLSESIKHFIVADLSDKVACFVNENVIRNRINSIKDLLKRNMNNNNQDNIDMIFQNNNLTVDEIAHRYAITELTRLHRAGVNIYNLLRENIAGQNVTMELLAEIEQIMNEEQQRIIDNIQAEKSTEQNTIKQNAVNVPPQNSLNDIEIANNEPEIIIVEGRENNINNDINKEDEKEDEIQINEIITIKKKTNKKEQNIKNNENKEQNNAKEDKKEDEKEIKFEINNISENDIDNLDKAQINIDVQENNILSRLNEDKKEQSYDTITISDSEDKKEDSKHSSINEELNEGKSDINIDNENNIIGQLNKSLPQKEENRFVAISSDDYNKKAKSEKEEDNKKKKKSIFGFFKKIGKSVKNSLNSSKKEKSK